MGSQTSESEQVKILVSLYPEDINRLDRVAAWFIEPGARPNRSYAIREALRTLEKSLRKNPRKGID